MPTTKHTCDRCEGTPDALSPTEVKELTKRINTIRAALDDGDMATVRKYLQPPPREKFYPHDGHYYARKPPERRALDALDNWRMYAENVQQRPCEHCGGAGSLERRTLGWELIEGLVAVGPDGDGKEHRQVTHRCRVPGGWMVKTYVTHHVGLTFVPDPDHTWEP